MPKNEKDKKITEHTPTSIRIIALMVFSGIIVYKLVIAKEVIPEWVLFVLVAIVAGGSSLGRILDKIVDKLLGK